MKKSLLFILFLFYVVTIFMIENFIILGLYAVVNILVILFLHISIKSALKNLLILSPFILFTFVVNIWLDDIIRATLILIRLILVCNITYCFKRLLSPMELSEVIEVLLTPLKIVKINPKDVSLIISIALAFIPILSDELREMKYGLKAKGVEFKIKNMKFFMTPLLNSVLKRIDDISYSLQAKGYEV